MKDIKFRAWRNYEKYMVTSPRGVLTAIQHVMQLASQPGFSNINNQPCEERYELMQYTGLKDSDGKEIYKGDIVDCKMVSADRTHYIEEYIAVVEEDICNPCFVLKQANGTVEYDFVKCGLMVLKVIGNIYENPELLEV